MTREQGDFIAREEIANGWRKHNEDSRQRVLPLDRVIGNNIETHVDDWASRLRDAKAGLGPWPLPMGHILFNHDN